MLPSPTATPESSTGEEGIKPGWADKDLWSTLRFLALPGAVGVAISVFGVKLPGWALYGVGAIVGFRLFFHTLKHDAEWLMAAAIIYLPLNLMFPVPLGPGMNGTNVLMLFLLFCWFRQGRSDAYTVQTADTVPTPAVSLVRAYAIVTLISVPTCMVTIGPWWVGEWALDLKGWFDQFIIFFTFLRLIRNGNMARRLMVYMMIGSLIVLALGFQEWLEKRDASSIEKARLLGPQLQPNDFGAFLAYATAPYLALLLSRLGDFRSWLVAVPYLGVTARILLATFSRGAYLGMGLAAVVATYVRGKLFLVGAIILGLTLVAEFPEIVPKSMRDRMAHTTSHSSTGEEELDQSAVARIILWKAALKMTAESPVFGWGFRSFPKFCHQYTETPVRESDNHNMYLYLSSQMGIPAVLLFVLLLWRMYSLGARLYRAGPKGFTRTIGMSAAALAPGTFLINMFGSRMVDICVTVYFWVTLAVVARLTVEMDTRPAKESV
jgi:putative inorganic carbon (hco3(-)) transporter